MTRGGYLFIIGLLAGLFIFQQYAHEKMIDRYEALIINQNRNNSFELQNKAVSDSLNELKSSFDEIVSQAKITPEKHDTIIIHNHITKVYPEREEKITNLNTESHALETAYRESQ